MMFEGGGFGTSANMYYDTVLKQAFARGLRTHANDLPVTCKQSILLGRYLLSEYNGYFYSKSQNLARELCKAYDRALQNYDVLLMPTVPRKAQALPLANMSLTGEKRNAAFTPWSGSLCCVLGQNTHTHQTHTSRRLPHPGVYMGSSEFNVVCDAA
ncbi:amidase-like isoform X2 [Oculina patagonica]